MPSTAATGRPRTGSTRRTVVPDRHGRPVRLVPGRWDASAHHAYARGQCLALAVAAGTATDRPLTVQSQVHRGRRVLRHCYVQWRPGVLLDADGLHPAWAVERVAERHGERLETMPVRAAWRRYAGDMVRQDVPVARTFVPALLERVRRTGRRGAATHAGT